MDLYLGSISFQNFARNTIFQWLNNRLTYVHYFDFALTEIDNDLSILYSKIVYY